MAIESTVLLVLVALLYGALAAWLLYLEPTHTVHRSFALFLFLRGLTGAVGLASIVNRADAPFWDALRGYTYIALPFVALDFFIVYNWRQRSGPRRAARLAILAIAVLLETAYLIDHALFSAPGAPPGPLAFLVPLAWVVAAAMGIWFAVAARRTPLPAQARFHRLLALAWACFALVDGALTYSSVPTSGLRTIMPDAGNEADLPRVALALLAAPLALVACVLLLTDRRVGPAGRYWVAGLSALAVLVPFTAGLYFQEDQGDPSLAANAVFFVLLGVARLLFPVILVYAVAGQTAADHGVFDLDYRMRITFRRSSIGGLLFGTYFVVSQLAGDIFPKLPILQSLGPAWSQAIGLACAGILLMLVQPLGRMADRMAHSALPHARPVKDMDAGSRLHLYEEQVQLAWSDGVLTRKERALLDRLRERLQVPLAQAVAIERRVTGTG